MDGILPIIHIDELFPSTQKDELLLFALTSSSSTQKDELPLYTLTNPSLQLRWTGSCLLFILTSSSPQLRRTSSYYSHCRALPSTQKEELRLHTLTSPSLQLRWTGSCLLFLLTSSSLNSDGRAPAYYWHR